MNYTQALEQLEKGNKVRLPEWIGFWFMDLEIKDDNIYAFTRTGEIVNAWEDKFQDREDWELVTEGLGYDWAINALKSGKRICRKGWNGKGMFIQLIENDGYSLNFFKPLSNNKPIAQLPWIGMKTADDCFVPWLASQTDMLANDWELFEMPKYLQI